MARQKRPGARVTGLLALPVIVLSLTSLTACGGGTVSTGSAPAPAATTTSAPTTSSPSTPGSPAGSSTSVPSATGSTVTAPTTGGLPAEFPVPAGATVGSVVDDGHEVAAQVRVDSTSSAFAYYLTALPANGWTVVSSDRTLLPQLGEIRLSGHGFAGNSQLAFTGSTVTVQLDRP